MQPEGKPEQLAGRLRRINELKGWRQKELAEALGVNLDRVKSLMTGKAKKLLGPETDALVDQHQVRREFLATGEPPVLKTDAELAVERQLSVLGAATRKAAGLDVPDWVKRTAQEWLLAVERGDSERVLELAKMATAHTAQEERAHYLALDDKRLEKVIAAVLGEVTRQEVKVPAPKLASLILTLLESTPEEQEVSRTTVTRLVRLAA